MTKFSVEVTLTDVVSETTGSRQCLADEEPWFESPKESSELASGLILLPTVGIPGSVGPEGCIILVKT